MGMQRENLKGQRERVEKGKLSERRGKLNRERLSLEGAQEGR